ncbi:peptidase [Metabacillus iocasae]|uniref:Small secreted protein n=1 Tax=Priestia iocasae TaxID=2291674 RepID=A0ABS2QZG6_9BACI|nr:peptidase [Metabacillus iocasae]MBM7704876.1 putative small secreted protein [Metabacillus iocasae]
MKWTHVATGFALGFASAYMIQKNKSSLSSTEALQLVKQAFKRNGSIDGSWIQTSSKLHQAQGLTFEGYNGGIIRTVDNQQEHYEFFVDKASGAIIDLKLIS